MEADGSGRSVNPYKEKIIMSWVKKIMLIGGLVATSSSIADIDIDDFSSGLMLRIQTNCQAQESTVNANVPGGGRRITLFVAGAPNCNGNNQRYVSSLLEKGNYLVVNNDYGVNSRMELRYGINQQKNSPMNLDLRENGKLGYLNVTFAEGATYPLNFNVVVYMKDGRARSSCGLNTDKNKINGNFNISLPLDKFIYPEGLELPDYSDVDYIDIIVQSQKTNFAIKSVKVTSDFVSNSITVNGAKCYDH